MVVVGMDIDQKIPRLLDTVKRTAEKLPDLDDGFFEWRDRMITWVYMLKIMKRLGYTDDGISKDMFSL